MRARVLFSEGSSLTAREFVSVLGPAGHHLEVLDPNPLCLCRFSRWVRHVHRCPAPAADPLGYVDTVNAVLGAGAFDVLLPTHEQAWLFAEANLRLDSTARIAVAAPEAFSRVQSKIEFARLFQHWKPGCKGWVVVLAPHVHVLVGFLNMTRFGQLQELDGDLLVVSISHDHFSVLILP